MALLRLTQLGNRRCVQTIFLIVLGRSARGQIAVALALVLAERADPLHVLHHHRLDAQQILCADA